VTSNPAVERVLAAAIALLLVVGLVGVATVKDDDRAQVDTASATSTTAGDGGDGGADVGTGVPTTAAGVGATTTFAPAGGTPTTARSSSGATTTSPAGKDPGPAQPPKLGVYRYNTKKNEVDTTTEVRVEKDAAQVPGEQRFTLSSKEGESNNTMSNLISWRGDGIYLRATTFPNPTGGPPIECDWEPDLLDRKLPTKAGLQWDVDSTCHVTFGAAAGTFHLKGHAKVDGARRVTIAGQGVDTWLITQTAHLDIDFVYNGQPIHAENDSTTQDYWAAPRGITVKTIENSTSKDPSGKTSTSKTERELQSLTPSA
jgi:hypothetical protein